MQRPLLIPNKQAPIKGAAFKLAIVGQKQNNFQTPSYQGSSDPNQDNTLFQNLRVSNSRQKTEEKSDLSPNILKAKSYNQVVEIGYKQIPTAFVESHLREKPHNIGSLTDELVQNHLKNNYFPASGRPKSNSITKRSLSIKNDPKKPLVVPFNDNHMASLVDKFKSHKFLKPLEGEKLYIESSVESRKSPIKDLPSPDITKQRKSVTGGELEDASRQIPNQNNHIQSVNYSYFNDDFYSALDLQGSSFRYPAAEGSSQIPDQDPPLVSNQSSEVIQIIRSGQVEDAALASQTDRNIIERPQFLATVGPSMNQERSSQPRNFKISNVSPRKQRIRPPTSPTSSAGNPFHLQANLQKVRINNDILIPGAMQTSSGIIKSGMTPQPEQGSTFNARVKRATYINNHTSLSPPKFKPGGLLVEKGRIAEIKQHVLKADHYKSPEKLRPISHQSGAMEIGEQSIIDDGMSQDLDDMSFDDAEEDVDESLPTTRSVNKRIMLLESVYEGRPPTVFFPYPTCCEKTREVTRTLVPSQEEEKGYDMKYKSLAIGCITRTFEAAGFRRTGGSQWNVLWGKPKYDRVKDMNKYQKTNHFPGCWEVGRKDGLWRNLSKQKRQYPMDFGFIPSTYLLSTDYERFMQVKEAADNKAIWIMKPCASACGRGIKLINKRTKLTKKKDYLVSEYISNPHLINGLKYDLRVYVLVTSFDPLKIYLYEDGLVRFCTEKYDTNKKHLKQRFVHLTNWSVNKYSENFIKNKGGPVEDDSSKWSFYTLKKKFKEMGIDYDGIFDKIKDIIIKTLISVEPLMLNSLSRTPEHKNNCFELYGFDILLDSTLKPWLMEVNVCPSLNSSSYLDKKIKTSLICDIMHIIGIQPFSKKKYEEDSKKRLLGMEGRKHVAKNINDMLDLNEQNCVEKLSAEDWNVLFETDEENHRRGDFNRIFPLRDNIATYSKYFEYQRYNNVIVWQWLKSRTNFLEKISQKVSNASS